MCRKPTIYFHTLIFTVALIVTATTGIATGFAQATGDAFTGFRSNNDSPIQIEADSLEVRDTEKLAVFKGNVDVKQGETTMRAASLRVYYDGSVKPGETGGSQGISRIEAKGKVIVTSGDNKATGSNAVFNMQTQLVTLTGGVVLTQCENIIRGKKLTVNLDTGKAQLAGQGRVQALFSRGDGQGGSSSKGCK